jgi:L-malate glycosyltransferase
MKAKVLVISNYQPTHTMRPEIEIFIGLAKLGYEVHVMSGGKTGYETEFAENGIKHIDFHPQKKGSKTEIAFVRSYLQEQNIDILQLFNNKAILAGIPASKGLKVKVVLYRGYTGNVAWWDPISYTKFLHPRVDKIVCNSIGVEKYFHKQLFFDKTKTVTINKGHRAHWYSSTEPVDIRKELGLPADAFVMAITANDRRMKGIKYLLAAMQILPPSIKAHLLLIGQGLEKKAYLRQISNCPAPERVHILGYRSDALGIVASSNIFVLSSIKGESITKSVIEAMSLSVAPLITDIAGNTELVENGHSGIVVPARNPAALAAAVEDMYSSPELVAKLGANASLRIRNVLTTERTIEEYDIMYRNLMAK